MNIVQSVNIHIADCSNQDLTLVWEIRSGDLKLGLRWEVGEERKRKEALIVVDV